MDNFLEIRMIQVLQINYFCFNRISEAMKKILLLTFIVSTSVFSAFSQIDKSLKIDTTSQNLSIFKYSKPNAWNGNDMMNIFKGNKFDNNLPNLSGKRDNFPMIVISDIKSNDRMPCIKPEGFFSMRIYKPNTKYVLLNK